MKVEGGMAAGTILHKVKVKEEAKECCGYQQSSSTGPSTSSTSSSSSSGSPSVSTATASNSNGSSSVYDSNGVASVVATPLTSNAASGTAPTASGTAHQPSAIVCHPSTAAASSIRVNADPFPVEHELKTKAKATRDKSVKDDARPEVSSPSPHGQRVPAGPSTCQSKQSNGARTEYKTAPARSSSDNDSPAPSHTLKPEAEDAIGSGSSVAGSGDGEGGSGNEGTGNSGNCRTEEKDESSASFLGNVASNRCINGVFAGHGELKSVLGTVVKFATGISPDTGDTVLTLVLALLSGSMTAEEFHSALQEATNYSLKGFVLPHLKQQLPSLQRDLSNAARASNQSCAQFLRSHEAAVLEAVGLVTATDQVEVFGEHAGNGIASGSSGNQCSAHYAIRSNSNPGAIQHTNNATGGLHHYSSAASHAPKRRASDTPYYENGAAILDDVPVYGKRLTTPWSHHHPPQQPPSTENSSPYCWYHPLHSSSSSIQSHAHRHTHGHGSSPIPAGSVQMSQMNSFAGAHHLLQQPQQQVAHVQPQNGSLDDEWKNIHMMLNCILGMVEKTKKALAILQTRGCFDSAAAALQVPSAAPSQNGGAASGSNPTSTNGSQVESSTGDREGSLKRLSGEIVAQTIRAIEDKVAEVKRKDEEAVKRAVMAEVQRAVRVAVAESRATERLRVHRLLDVPLSQRSHSAIRQGPYLRVHGNPGPVEGNTRTVAPSTATNSIPTNSEDEKEPHLQNVSGSSCWNCGRPALETCGGCGIARYCGSFCQHRDWEAGGHHATCNNPPPREPRRSASRSPPRVGSGAISASVNESNVAAPIPASVASKGK